MISFIFQVLNGQEIAREERRGAECDYIKRYGQKWHESKNNDELRSSFLKEHGRYMDLIKSKLENKNYLYLSFFLAFIKCIISQSHKSLFHFIILRTCLNYYFIDTI